jgi:hypothetical protein
MNFNVIEKNPIICFSLAVPEIFFWAKWYIGGP